MVLAACGSTASPSPAPATVAPTVAPPATIGITTTASAVATPPSTAPSSTPSPVTASPATSSLPTSPPASRTPAPSQTPAGSPACAGGATPPLATVPAAGATPPAIALEQIASGLVAPIGVISARDRSGRLFIVGQGGLIRIVDAGGTLLAQPFLDLRDQVSAGGERGLLGLAFHPTYVCNGRFFVDYTDTNGNTVVAEYRVSDADPNRADPTPVAALLHIGQPYPNHNGGEVAFGPDGYLYVGLGDGGSAEDPQGNGQRLDTLLGKLLRIDVDHAAGAHPYAIPPDNCTGCPAGALPEIFAYGLRNPWRYSFDRATGDLWIGDVGQDRWEEVDHLPVAAASGANFGWSRMEGNHCLHGNACDRGGLTLPVAEYGHSDGDCAVTGGYVYRGSSIPALVGWYLFSDYCSGRIRALGTGTDRTVTVLLETGGNIATFGEDEAGELYVADVSRGTLSRVVAAP